MLNSDYRNVVHRHEPPVTSTPVKVLLHDTEREFIVIDKPGSIVRLFPASDVKMTHNSLFAPQPVHASGRYFRNSLVEILKNDFGYQKAYSASQSTLSNFTAEFNDSYQPPG
jgi:tRNA pseudouridine32 synthase